jgi:hypothetical protein
VANLQVLQFSLVLVNSAMYPKFEDWCCVSMS